MTTDAIVITALIAFGALAIGQVSVKLVPAPWDIYVAMAVGLAWMVLVFKGWEWWNNRR